MAQPTRAATTGADYGAVGAWGRDNVHQTDVPDAAIGGIVAISAQSELALALTWDGHVVAWGDNHAGQANVPAGLSNVVAISSGGSFAVALKSNGQVVAWGSDAWHQTEVPPAAQSGVVAVSAGSNFVVALKKDGSIVAWGDDSFGATDIPFVVIPHGRVSTHVPLSNLKAVSASGQVLGIKQDGTVAAWGWNKYGQTNVPAGLSGVKAVAAGFRFSLALDPHGYVRAWGDNGSGELTTPCTLYNALSHTCVSPIGNFTAIAAGDKHALALNGATGHITAWGDNTYGQTNVASPPEWQGGYVAVAAGMDFSLALLGKVDVPFAPSAIDASAGDGVAMVEWHEWLNDDHGAPIDHCTVSASPGGVTHSFTYKPDNAGWNKGLMTGLTNGTTYTFTTRCTNGLGTGPASAPSNPVTPMAGEVYSLEVHLGSPGASGVAAAASGGSSSPEASAAASASASEPVASASSSAGPSVSPAPSPGASGSGSGGDNPPYLIGLAVVVVVVVVAGGAAAVSLARRRRVA